MKATPTGDIGQSTNHFEFCAGAFCPIKHPGEALLPDDPHDLQLLGYVESHDVGVMGTLRFWEADSDTTLARRYPWLCEVCPFLGRFFVVWITDAPSLLQFLPLVAPLVHFDAIDGPLAELATFAKRYFRAEHGHDLGDACNACDPHTVELWRTQRREREQARRRAEAAKEGGAK